MIYIYILERELRYTFPVEKNYIAKCKVRDTKPISNSIIKKLQILEMLRLGHLKKELPNLFYIDFTLSETKF